MRLQEIVRLLQFPKTHETFHIKCLRMTYGVVEKSTSYCHKRDDYPSIDSSILQSAFSYYPESRVSISLLISSNIRVRYDVMVQRKSPVCQTKCDLVRGGKLQSPTKVSRLNKKAAKNCF